LDGTGSDDPDGDALTFAWSAPVGISLSDATGPRASFLAQMPGAYHFALVVSDGRTASAPDTVVVRVMNPLGTVVPTPGGTEHFMALVPAGEFTMGSASGQSDEAPVHRVYVDAFYIDQFEVTNAQYKAFLGSTGAMAPTFSAMWYGGDLTPEFSGDQHPVVSVTRAEAQAYCAWAGLRLPTEAEWEKAARGTNERVYPWGNEFGRLRANTGSDSGGDKGDGFEFTAPVGSFPEGVSPYGAYDMAGNAHEWVSDQYGTYPDGAVANPSGAPSGIDGIARGGSWGSSPFYVRTSVRLYMSPGHTNFTYGFRCAR
jgi:serine/threonine-protein kinase